MEALVNFIGGCTALARLLGTLVFLGLLVVYGGILALDEGSPE